MSYSKPRQQFNACVYKVAIKNALLRYFKLPDHTGELFTQLRNFLARL